MSAPPCDTARLAAIAELWGAEVRVRSKHGTWRVSVVDGRGRTLAAVQNARFAFAAADALRDMLALDAAEVSSRE